mgnify:CR=1 FL=1
MIFEVEDRSVNLINQLLKVWEDSVRHTHLFLKDEEIKIIKMYVPQALGQISHLIIIKNDDGFPIAFMGIEDKRLEMLFIKNNERGNGLGRRLLNYDIENYKINEVTVNEQNPDARGFYEHMGFETYKRTKLDEQGRPYPLLYMRLKK